MDHVTSRFLRFQKHFANRMKEMFNRGCVQLAYRDRGMNFSIETNFVAVAVADTCKKALIR
jgi:hypothetical protein